MGKIMGFASSFLKEIQFGERISNSKKIKDESSTTPPTTYICRDELDIKKKPKIKKQVKLDLVPKYQYPTEEESNEEQKKKNTSTSFDGHANNGVKMKILMKKENATRLLLKCREERVLEFMDVAQELAQIPSTSVRVH